MPKKVPRREIGFSTNSPAEALEQAQALLAAQQANTSENILMPDLPEAESQQPVPVDSGAETPSPKTGDPENQNEVPKPHADRPVGDDKRQTTTDEKQFQSPKPSSQPVKDMLVMFGALLWKDRLVLPKQVVPFSEGHNLKVRGDELRHVRWQVHCRATEPSPGAEAHWAITQVSSAGKGDWSEMASRKTGATISYPDGPCGFTGRRIECSGPVSMERVRSWMKLVDVSDVKRWHTHLEEQGVFDSKISGVAVSEPRTDIAGILPKFYLEPPPQEVQRLRSFVHPNLKQVYDLASGTFRWMYELGHDRFSPIVITERPGFGPDEARVLHDTLAGSYLLWKIFIGGSGLKPIPKKVKMLLTVLELSENEQTFVGKHYPFGDVLRLANLVVFNPVIVRLPRDEKSNPQKSKPAFNETRRDSFTEYVERVVNEPAHIMAGRLRKKPI